MYHDLFRDDRDELWGKLQASKFGRVLFHLFLLLSSDEFVLEEEESPDWCFITSMNGCYALEEA
jgi:hypothetical protein